MSNDKQKQMGKLVSKVWADNALRERFISHPKDVLRENGVNIPDNIEVKVYEDSDHVRHVVIPQSPKALSDEQLDAVSGGAELTITAIVPS